MTNFVTFFTLGFESLAKNFSNLRSEPLVRMCHGVSPVAGCQLLGLGLGRGS